jgi:hypothetical protein
MAWSVVKFRPTRDLELLIKYYEIARNSLLGTNVIILPGK